MSKIHWWAVPVETAETIWEGECDETFALKLARGLIGDWPTLCRAEWRGKVVDMAVDDCGLLKGLPPNERATEVHLKCCMPGTIREIVGTVVIFERRLS